MNLEMLVYEEGWKTGKPGDQKKKPRCMDLNQQQTQPTYGATRSEPPAPMMEGESSDHCATAAPPLSLTALNSGQHKSKS